MEFWSAVQLRNEFEVIASFYRIEVGNKTFLCRNNALIKRKGISNQENWDAVVVMANPGSCKPKNSNSQPPIIQNNYDAIPYVEVKDDPTQHQLMKMMKAMNWDSVAICNLSDICSGNMEDLKEKHSFIEMHSFKDHTIFADSRIAERKQLLQEGHIPIILAWGKDSSIRKLACNALNKIPKENQIFGLQFEHSDWGFRHPYPRLKARCVEWLEDITNQLRSANIN